MAFWTCVAQNALGAEIGIVEVALVGVDAPAGRVRVRIPSDLVLGRGSELVLFKGVAPVARGTWLSTHESEAEFRFHPSGDNALFENDLRACVLPANLIALLRPRWPTEAALLTEVDSVGPGGRSVWVHAGQNFGLQAGDTCLLKVGRQPAARIELRFVGPDVSYGAVTPLVADLQIRPGVSAAVWPTPGEGRAGRASSLVSFVETTDREVRVWVPSVPNIPCPPEPHLDYLREGRFIGSGTVMRQDDRFWYASFRAIPFPVERVPSGTTQPSASAPTSQANMHSDDRLPQVGDEVRVRTEADIDQRRFVARVFELTPTGGALLDAGENDGLAVGQEGRVYRDGAVIGRVEVARAQPTYAVIVPLPKDREAVGPLQPGDEVRFGPLPPSSVEIGTVERVVAKDLITVRLKESRAPLGTPLAVVARGRTVGVAVLVVSEDGLAGGFVIPASVTVPPAPGMQLVRESDE